MKTRPKILLGTLVCFTSWFHLYGDITIQGPTPANHTPTSKCPAKDGGNELNPAVPQHIPPPAATGGIIEELRSGDNPYPGWTFTNGPALSGTLNIDYYHSRFLSAHYSGAQIQATYTPGSNDPARLRFVQMIDTTAPITNTLKGPYIDPYPDDDKLATNRPFYYTEEETASYGNSFYDFSKRSHPPNSKVEWTGILHLSSWDGNTPGTVTLHDGIKWGFKAACATNAPQKPKAVKQKDKVVVTYTSGGPVVDLEHTGLLGPATTWLKVTNGIVETNGTFVYTVNEPGDQEFFRLSS